MPTYVCTIKLLPFEIVQIHRQTSGNFIIFSYSLIHLCIHTFTFIHSLTHSFNRSFIHLYVHLFIYLFINIQHLVRYVYMCLHTCVKVYIRIFFLSACLFVYLPIHVHIIVLTYTYLNSKKFVNNNSKKLKTITFFIFQMLSFNLHVRCFIYQLTLNCSWILWIWIHIFFFLIF